MGLDSSIRLFRYGTNLVTSDSRFELLLTLELLDTVVLQYVTAKDKMTYKLPLVRPRYHI